MRVAQKVEGVRNRWFDSLMIVLEDIRDDLKIEMPQESLGLRKMLTECVLANPNKFDIKFDIYNKKIIRSIINNGILPKKEILLAVSEIFGDKVIVHYGMISPVYTNPKKLNKIIQLFICNV